MILQEFGHQRLSAITMRAIQGYLAKRAEQDKLAPKTFNLYLGVFKAVFKKAQAWGFMSHDPAKGITQRRVSDIIPDALTDEEVSASWA
ncbi:MAG: hypothetical protein VCF24_24085, partial [Candidatus Latescibacterota bacterium]